MGYAKQKLVNIVMDIETVRLPVTDEERLRFEKEYAPPKNYKDPEKIAAHKEEAATKLDESTAFKLHRNKLISIALGVIGDSDVKGIECFYGDDTEKVLKGALDYLAESGDFRFVGWNCNKFDLPILAKEMGRFGFCLPRRQGKWDTVDLCVYPFAYTGLKDAARAFGLSVPPIDGSDVAELYSKQDWTTIAEYNKSDVRLTGRLFLLASNVWEL